MKTEPTALDREAATLFTPAPGMRAIMSDSLFGGRWVRIAVADKKLAGCYETSPDTWDAYGKDWWGMDALDTDDPATVGCMLAQVEAVVGKPIDTWMSTKGPMPELPYAVESGPYVTIGRGATRGHALLAAMRGLKRAT